MSKLEVGDSVAEYRYGIISGILTIERVTKTQAITNSGVRLRREHDSSRIGMVGGDSFSSLSYRVINKESEEEIFSNLKKKKLIRKIKDRFKEIDGLLDTLDVEQLTTLSNKLKEE